MFLRMLPDLPSTGHVPEGLPTSRRMEGRGGARAQVAACGGESNMLKRCRTLPPSVLIAATVAAAFTPVTPARSELANPDGVAVIIGNRDYAGGRISPVIYAHRDAEAFKRYVLDVRGFDPNNVIELRDATKSMLEYTFGGAGERRPEGFLWRYLNPEGGSDVVVFYSGHGVPGRKDRREYLLPSDAVADDAESTAYPLDALYANLSKLVEARSVTVFIDACFSGDSHQGPLVNADSPVHVKVSRPAETPGRFTVLAAASGTQIASWDESVGHGLFTHHLLDALYGKGDRDRNGRVTAREVKRYLDRHMTQAARRELGRHQKANFIGRGETVVASAPAGGYPDRPMPGPADDFAPGRHEGLGARPATAADANETPPPPAEPPAAPAPSSSLARPERVLAQRGLKSLGFDVGTADGRFGPRTRSAIRAYQEASGTQVTGLLTRGEFEALASAVAELERREAAHRVEKTRRAEEVRRVEEARRAEEARSERERLAEEEARRMEAERLARERLAAEARQRAERAAHARATRIATMAAYDDYLRSFADGPGAEEIRGLRNAAVRRVEERAPGRRFRDCPDCPEMVVVPAGSFQMGSPRTEVGRSSDEGPQRRVTIPEPFAVGRFEVTFAEWEACLRAGACMQDPGDRGWGRGRRPVIGVRWEDARAYVQWLSRETGKRYRLLTEAEWEYSARAGSTSRFPWGRKTGNGRANCFQVQQRMGQEPKRTAPVGSFPPNAVRSA